MVFCLSLQLLCQEELVGMGPGLAGAPREAKGFNQLPPPAAAGGTKRCRGRPPVEPRVKGGPKDPKEPKGPRAPSRSNTSTAQSERGLQAIHATVERHSLSLSCSQVLNQNTKKGDLYQVKRCMQSLERKGMDAEAASLESRMRTANAALMLVPQEMLKLPWDQVQVLRTKVVDHGFCFALQTQEHLLVCLLLSLCQCPLAGARSGCPRGLQG